MTTIRQKQWTARSVAKYVFLTSFCDKIKNEHMEPLHVVNETNNRLMTLPRVYIQMLLLKGFQPFFVQCYAFSIKSD